MLWKLWLIELAFVQDIRFLFEWRFKFILKYRHIGTFLQGAHNEFVQVIEIFEKMLTLHLKRYGFVFLDTIFTAIWKEFNLQVNGNYFTSGIYIKAIGKNINLGIIAFYNVKINGETYRSCIDTTTYALHFKFIETPQIWVIRMSFNRFQFICPGVLYVCEL